MPQATFGQWIIGIILVLASLGILIFRRPVHASLSFLVALIMLSMLYLELAAEFVGIMQILVYAGAILVIFMFVIILFQDAHEELPKFQPQSSKWLIAFGVLSIIFSMILFLNKLSYFKAFHPQLPLGFGTIEQLGYFLYTNFFFPFEAIIFLFLVSIVGTIYIGKKEA